MTTWMTRSLMVAALLLSGCASGPPAEAHTLKRQQECLALAMYWEARGEGERGMTAVGWTILNRVHSPDFPSTPCAVVYEGGERPGCQFSWYCDGRSDRPRDWQSWQQAMLIAARLLTRPPADPTRGARFYHSSRIPVPWRRPRQRTAQIGEHVFYR